MENRLPKSKPNLLLKAALHYLGLGWNVIPLDNEKKPRLDTWEKYQYQRVTNEQIRRWWVKWPSANIAVLTGKISGLVVVDVDGEAGWKHLKPYLDNETLNCLTGKGTHLYFLHPGGVVPNAVRFLPGVDCRGDGGYVVAPPSYHPKAKRKYRWENTNVKPAALPKGLLKLILEKSGEKLTSKDWTADIKEGARDVELTKRAGSLLRDKEIPPAEALTMLEAWNREHCKPPLSGTQVKKIIASIAGREEKKETTPERMRIEQFRDVLRRYGEVEESWVIKDWLPRAGCGLIVGSPKNFKTWLSVDLALSVMTGRPFLGKFPLIGKTGPVLLVQQEDPFGGLAARIAKGFNMKEPTEVVRGKDVKYELDCRFCQELDNLPFHWITSRDFSFHNNKSMELLEQRIAEIRPLWVIIDPLYVAGRMDDFLAGTAIEMNRLKRLRDRYGCGFIVIHHTTWSGKASEESGSLWGTVYLDAWTEFGWKTIETKKKKEGKVRIRRYFKEGREPDIIKVVFNITDWGYTVETGADDASIDEKIRERIMEGASFKSMDDIAEAVERGKTTVSRAVKRMGLEKDEEGCYRQFVQKANRK